ncbi:MAG: hypothetical protein ACTS7E_05135 [Arsenophonus sp. NC-CH8-MAG3]
MPQQIIQIAIDNVEIKLPKVIGITTATEYTSTPRVLTLLI